VFVFSDNLVLCLFQLLVTIPDLGLEVGNLDLQLVINSLHLRDLSAVLLCYAGKMALKLLNQLLLVFQLLLHHIKLLHALLV